MSCIWFVINKRQFLPLIYGSQNPKPCVYRNLIPTLQCHKAKETLGLKGDDY